MRRTSSFTWLMTSLALIALGLGLLSLPDDSSQSIRLVARDLSRPGQTVTRMCIAVGQAGWRGVRDWQARRADLDRMQSELAAVLRRNEEYHRLLTDTRKQLNQAESRAGQSAADQSTEPLFLAELVEARVLGQETVALASGRKILNVGTATGVGESLLVVEAGRSTLDVGLDQGVSIHQPVFSGDIVVGRTAKCGSYTSSLQPVTDANFQGAAQLLKKTDGGFQQGPEGMLEGTGKTTCRLTGISFDKAVEVGDEVYTRAADPLLPYPMFYGRIVRANLEDGDLHWDIEVEPAANQLRLTFVRVLKPKENRARVVAN